MQAKAISKECDPMTCGCSREIQNLKDQNMAIWESINEIRKNNNKMLNRVNALLGSLALACLLLVANLIFK